MKHKLSLSFAIEFIILLFLVNLNQTLAKSTHGKARSVITSPIEISQSKSISFGSLTPGLNFSEANMNDNGEINVQGSASYLGGAQLGEFNLIGYGNNSYNIKLPDEVILQNNNDNMMVTLALVGDGARNLESGQGIFKVKGSLEVNQNQQPGLYVGSYNIVINYN